MTLPIKWSALAKIAVSGCLIFLILRGVNLHGVARRLGGADFRYLAVALLFLALQIVVLSVRWSLIAALCALSLPLWRALRLTLISLLFNQLPAGTMSGDAARIYMAGSPNGRFREAAASVLVDRMYALAVLAVLTLLAAPWMFAHVADKRLSLGTSMFAFAVLSGMALVLVMGPPVLRMLGRPRLEAPLIAIVQGARAVVSDRSMALFVMMLSAVMHVTSGLIVAILARSLGLPLPILASVVLTLPGILATVIPFSIAGWGVREGAMVIALTQAGLSGEEAVSVSLLFGLCFTVAALPGAALLLLPQGPGQRRLAWRPVNLPGSDRGSVTGRPFGG